MSNPNIAQDSPTTFKPGQSGNPAGRPKGIKNLTTKVREALEKIAEGKEFTYEEALVKTVLHKAIIEKDPNMIRLIWNYMDGMPHQSSDTTLNIPQTFIDLIKNVTNPGTNPSIQPED